MDKEAINIMISQAQSGNSAMRESLIAEHQVFVKQIVAKNVTGYGDINARDEYSIGLIAFNEAIDSYKPGFRSFQSFAASVIKKRLIDYYRTQKKHKEHGVYIEDIPPLVSEEQYETYTEKMDLKYEMQSFVQQLVQFGITLRDLVNESPKHLDSRLLCIKIAKTVTEDTELTKHFLKYHSLPLTLLLKKLHINAKTVERNRKFIISICLVLLSNLDSMKSYVNQLGQGGDNNVI